MDTGGQLKLLLWKDFLVRRRHPGVAVLVFGWAIAVFLILYSVRESVDSEYYPTCQYKARALPSTGLFPFLQSFICNVDNKCGDRNQYEEVPRYTNARLTGLANQLQTAFTNDTVIEVIKSLPDMVGIMKALGDGLDTPNLEGIFGAGLKIANFFDDSDLVKTKLRSATAVLDSDILDDIFDSSLKLGKIFKSFESSDMSSSICDPDQLEKYLILEHPEKINDISDKLCNISGKAIPSMLKNVINHVDFSGLLKMIGKVTERFKKYNLYNDVKNVVEIVLNLNMVKENLPAVLKLPDWLPEIIPAMKYINHTHLDPEYVDEAIRTIEPHFKDSEQWPTVKNIISQIMDTLVTIQNKIIANEIIKPNSVTEAPPTNFSQLVDRIQNGVTKLSNLKTENLSPQPELISEIANTTMNLIQSFAFNTSEPWLKAANLIDLLMELFKTHDVVKDISMLTMLYNDAILIVQDVLRKDAEMDNIMYDISQRHSSTVSTILSLGPDFIEKIFNCFNTVTCTTIIVENRHNISELFCDKQKTESILKNSSTIKGLEVLCNMDFNDFIEDIIKEFKFNRLNETLNRYEMSKGSLSMAVTNTENFLDYIASGKRRHSKISWEQILPDINNKEWQNIIKYIHRQGYISLINVDLSFFKDMMKGHAKFNKMFNISNILLEAFITEFRLIPITFLSMADVSGSKINKVLTNILMNKTEMLKLKTIDDFESYFCDLNNYNNTDNETDTKIFICEAISHVNLRMKTPWYLQPLPASIHSAIKINHENNVELNWDEFIKNSQEAALILDEIMPIYFFSMHLFQENVWFKWLRNLDMDTKIRFGVELLTRIIDFIDMQYLSPEIEEKWLDINSMSSALNSFDTSLIAINSFSFKSSLSSTINDASPLTAEISHNITESLAHLLQDIQKIEEFDTVTELTEWLKNPCTETESNFLNQTSDNGNEVLLALQNMACNTSQFENDRKFTNVLVQNKTTKNQGEAWKLLTSNIHSIEARNYGYYINNDQKIKLFATSLTSIKLKSVLIEKLNKLTRKTILAKKESLSQLMRNSQQCKKDNKNSIQKCNELNMEVARYTTKFITAGLNEVANKIRNYLHTINETTGVDPILLLGFSNKSAVYNAYLNLPDVIKVFVHSYRSQEFEKQIIEKRTRGEKISCSDIMKSLTIPENNSVTETDIKSLGKYLCPSIFDWPVLQDNMLLSTVTKLQDMYLDIPVTDFNISYTALADNLIDLRNDLINMLKYGKINIKELWNKEWSDKMIKLFYDLRKLKFTTANTLTRYFKYIEEPSADEQTIVRLNLDPSYGFGEFGFVLKHISESLENLTSVNFNSPDISSPEDIQVIKDLFDFFPKEVVGVLTFAYFNNNGSNFSERLDEFCNGTMYMEEAAILVPSWIQVDKNHVIEKLCNITTFEEVTTNVFSEAELAKIKNYNANLEEVILEFAATLFNFINSNSTIHLSSTIKKHFDLNKIYDGSFSSDEELREWATKKSKFMAENSDRHEVLNFYEEVELTTICLKLLKGGDWWNKLKELVKEPAIGMILQLIERAPRVVLHLADAAMAPHFLYEITSQSLSHQSICSKRFDMGRYVKDNNVLAVFHKFCSSPTSHKPDVLDYFFNDTDLIVTVNEEKLADHIFDFEKSLIDLIKTGPTKFETPNWLNENLILKEYKEYEIQNTKPLRLLQTVTTIFNEILDVGSIFYKENSENCTWCTWATILVREVNRQLSKAPQYVEFTCNAPRMNFTEIRQTLTDTFEWGSFFRDISSNNSYTVDEFDKEIHDIVEVIRVQIITFYSNKTLRALPQKCLTKLADSPALKNITTYITAVNEIIKTLNTSSIQFFKSPVIGISTENFLNLIVEHIPLMKPVLEILNSDFEKEFGNIILNNSTVSEILNAKIDVNLLKKIETSKDLVKYLSNKDLFHKLLQFPNTSNVTQIYEEIKSKNVPSIAKLLYESINKKYLDDNIESWRDESLTSLDWLVNIFNNLEQVLLNGGNILEFIANTDFSQLTKDSFNVSGILKGILEVLEKNSIEKLFQSLRDLVKNVSPIMRNAKLETDLYTLINGIEDLQIFKSLGLLRLKYKISNLVKDWGEVKLYMMDEIKLDKKEADEVLNASIDLTAILSSQSGALSVRDMICNPDQLIEILTFNTEDVHNVAENVSHAICSMEIEDIQNVASISIKNINFSKVLNNMMNSSINNILSSANLTEEDGRRVVKNIGSGVELMPYLRKIISNVSSEFHELPKFEKLELKNNTTQGLIISPDLLSSASKMLCGRPLVQSNNKLYKVIADATDFNADNFDALEKQTLPTEFCRNVYEDIVNMDAGKVIWSYIKPLIRGKILYTPNVPVVRDILKLSNTTFQNIAELADILLKITDGLTALEDKEKINHIADNIQDFMNSSIVQLALESALTSTTNKSFSLKEVNIKNMLNSFGGSQQINSALKFSQDFLKCVLLNRFAGFDSEAELEEEAKKLMLTNEFIAGVVFLNIDGRSKRSADMPRDIAYKIRMDIDSVPSTNYLKYKFWIPGPESDFLDELRYFRGFIQLQDLIDNAIIRMKSTEVLPVWETLTQEVPYACWTYDFFQSALSISQTFQVCFFFGLIVVVAAAVRYVVAEKESGNTMVMNVMGLRYFTHCLSWFIITLLEVLIVMICIFIILKVGRILPKTDSTLLFLYMIDFGFAIIMFCYMISSMFNSASLAAVGSAIFYLLSFMPYIIIISLETTLPFWAKMITNLSMSTSFCYGCLYIIRYEVQGIGLQWSNAWDTPIPGDSMSFGMTCIFVALDGILYGLIGYLCSRNRLDLHKIFYFLPTVLFPTASYNLATDNSTYVTFDNELFLEDNHSGENYLDDTISSTNIINDEPLKIGVTIKGLTKIYNSKKKTVKAIDEIDITLYTGQVTTLLGHNGAGKTTLIKILTGMMQPTSGQIIINSEIIENCSRASKYLGVCPQASVLINTMSTKEHLIFYAKLKTSKTTPEVMQEVMNMIDNMNLGHLSNEPVSHLSEGMRRRLCVAIAFIGKPKLVVLDEPSSGVDPVARRQIWDLVIRYKEGCTVLLTTHHLDEAELLSDRVVVLHKGKVLCAGSPLVLRQSYGSGYKIMVKYPKEKEKCELDENKVNTLLTTVKELAPNCSLNEIRDSEINITVPFYSPAGISNNFESVASVLEQNQAGLGFSSFAMNCTTLEQVFLDLCANADAKNGELLSKNDTISQLGKSYCNVFTSSVDELAPSVKDDEILIDTGEKLTGSGLSKFTELLKKRAIHCMFDWRVLVCALVLPTVFVAVAMGFSLIRPPHTSEPALRLSPDLYSPHTTSFISVDTNNMDSFINQVSREVVGLFPNMNLDLYAKTSRECVCEAGMQYCSKPSDIVDDTLLKLSNANDTLDWLIETQDEYIERRYGGWSFSDQPFNKSAMVVWYNNKGYHSMPSYLNTMNSAILRTVSPGSTITTYSHPLKLSVDQLSKSTIAQHIADVGIAMVLLIAFSLVPASGSIYLVQERVNEEKRLQFLCGVSPTMYWLVAFVWDIIVLLCALILAVIVFRIFGLPVYVARDNMAAISLLIFLYGWACIPFVHLAQILFNDASMANMVLFCVCTFIGITELACLLLMDILGKTQFVADFRIVLHKIYLLFPQFVLGDGLVEISKNNIQSDILKRFHMDTYISPLSWELMGLHYLSLALVGVVLFSINLMIENQWFRSFKKSTSVYPSDISCLETVNLTKEYKTLSGKHVAVNDLSLTVPFGQCLGLIGVNGAGKSTTFKMLTTELPPTSGRIFLQGRDICRKPLYTGEIGYCSQSDSLDPKLTVKQTLKLYLTLRGIENQKTIVNKMMAKFELSSYANRQTENLSGGNKRKLCAALSVLGKTSLILMDEPTSGMDPYSRNLVAQTIQQLIKRNRSVILTSHSVEDCEALCSTVAIMINGKVICQGSPHDLKERYGSGYIISVRLAKVSEQELLLELMQKHFTGAELMSRQYCSSQFSVPTEHTRISEMFNRMAKISEYVSVEDFNLVQSSLDQVFINLANKSNESTMNKEDEKIILPNMYSMDVL